MKKVLLALAAAIFSLSLAVYIAPLAGEAGDAQAEADEAGADAQAETDEAAEEAAEEACGPFVMCDPPGDFGEPGEPNDLVP